MAQGTAEINFGAHPGSERATVTVTGQSALTGTMLLEAWLKHVATGDHTEDDVIWASEELMFSVPQSLVIPGTGFTIVGTALRQHWGRYMVNWGYN